VGVSGSDSGPLFPGHRWMVDKRTDRCSSGLHGVPPGATINIDIRTIKAAFTVAAQWRRVPNNPFTDVKQIRTSQHKVKFLTHTDFDRLTASIKEKWFRDLVIFTTLTGLRRGEALNLQWSDLDEGKSIIVVESSAEYRVKGGK